MLRQKIEHGTLRVATKMKAFNIKLQRPVDTDRQNRENWIETNLCKIFKYIRQQPGPLLSDRC